MEKVDKLTIDNVNFTVKHEWYEGKRHHKPEFRTTNQQLTELRFWLRANSRRDDQNQEQMICNAQYISRFINTLGAL